MRSAATRPSPVCVSPSRSDYVWAHCGPHVRPNSQRPLRLLAITNDYLSECEATGARRRIRPNNGLDFNALRSERGPAELEQGPYGNRSWVSFVKRILGELQRDLIRTFGRAGADATTAPNLCRHQLTWLSCLPSSKAGRPIAVEPRVELRCWHAAAGHRLCSAIQSSGA